MTLEEKISQLEAELSKVKAEFTEKNQSVWLPEDGQKFLYLTGTGFSQENIFIDTINDNLLKTNNNIFKCDKSTFNHLAWYNDNVIKIQNRFMQLHELLCPDYFPDWDNSKKESWYLGIYEGSWHRYWTTRCDIFTVYFTEEAAKRACEILNAEKFMMGDDA